MTSPSMYRMACDTCTYSQFIISFLRGIHVHIANLSFQFCMCNDVPFNGYCLHVIVIYVVWLLFSKFCFQSSIQWRIQDLALGGAWTLSTGGGESRKAWKVLNVEVTVIYLRVVALLLLILWVKVVASEETNGEK